MITINGDVFVKVWLKEMADLEVSALKQIENLQKLPFLHHHIAIMPDVHCGYGMPIGGVISTEDVVIPNAVGVDIGCGMIFVETNIETERLEYPAKGSNGKIKNAIISDIMRNVPVGFAHNQNDGVMSDKLLEQREWLLSGGRQSDLISKCFNTDKKQLGSLGGGNHFIEIQADEAGKVCVMIHSGSRNTGKQVCDYFNKRAKWWNEQYHSKVEHEFDLAFLPLESTDGLDYMEWMNYCLQFAEESRAEMMTRVLNCLAAQLNTFTSTEPLDIHHNYASMENHYGKNVLVHRKGAVRAREGERVIIPGSMGTASYIAVALGNKESFQSCSHGAGRSMSRSKAKEMISAESVISDLDKKGVVIGKPNMKDVAEECSQAYKDIDEVIENEKDLIVPVKRLTTIAVVKG